MALIKCPDCGKEVSDKAKNCIHCGCPLNPYGSPSDARRTYEPHSGSGNPAPAGGRSGTADSGMMTACPRCGKQIAKDAGACPFCGSRAIITKKPAYKVYRIWMIICAVVILLLTILSIIAAR